MSRGSWRGWPPGSRSPPCCRSPLPAPEHRRHAPPSSRSPAAGSWLSRHEEGFAEYFLIGTLASLAVAMVAAIAVRASLGLSPL
jgi:hypothetical protein